MFDYYFFDLDGTLTDPAEGITNSFIHAIKYFGLEVPSYENLCTFIGPPLVATFQKEFGFDDEKAMEGVKKYREYFAQKGIFENKVYDGIENVLEHLQAKGKHLLVATSKPEEYSVKILEHFGLAKYFDFICGSNMDETRSKKEEVIDYALEKCREADSTSGSVSGAADKAGFDKSKVLMIGDREHDIIGAKKNGIKSCGVLYGYGSRQELEAAGADYIVDNVRNLLEL